jgi:biopolymer transport protein ExbB/TolQ
VTEVSIKNRFILILAVLTAIFFLGMVNSCSNASRQKAARDKEMAARLDLEEKMTKHGQEKAALEEQIKAKDQELAEEKAAHQATKKALVQEQLVNQNLKEEVSKIAKLKEALEEDLKDSLTGKSSRHKK